MRPSLDGVANGWRIQFFMPLTYQPFAESPVLEKLDVKPAVNVADGERLVSGVCGALLGIIGLSRGTLGGTLLAVLGGTLVYRGLSGHCHAYDTLRIDTAHPRKPVSAPPRS